MKTLPLSLLLLISLLLCLPPAHAQSPKPAAAPSATDCLFYISADDSFELFINGTLVWKDSQYDKVVQKPLPLQRGDVVTLTVTDQQGGLGGHLATVILRGETVLASTKDFRYTIDPAADFKTSPNLQNLRPPALEPLALSFGLGPKKQPKKAWTQKSDRNTGVVHFKFVVP